MPRPAMFATAVVLIVLLVVLLSSGGGTHRTLRSPAPPPRAGDPLSQQLFYLDREISRARR
jgi:hypothetical protein